MKQNDKKLYKNYIWNSIYQVVILLIPLFITPYVSRVLGPEKIGQYSYTRSIVAYFVLLGTAGSNMYAQKEIAYNKDDRHQRSCRFWEILIIRMILLFVSLMFYVPVLLRESQYTLLFTIQILDVVSILFDITWFFQGMELFGRITVRNVLVKILAMSCILLFVRQPGDIWKYVLIYSLSNLVGQLWMWVDIARLLEKPVLRDLSIKRHVNGIAQLVIPQIAIQIYLVVDKTMIELLTGDSSQTGYYEMAQVFQRTGVSIVTAFGTVAATRVAVLKSKADTQEIRKLINQSYKIVSFLGVPMSLGLCAVSADIIPWFLGKEYLPVIQIMMCLSPLITIIGYSNISGIQYMVPMGLQKMMTLSTVMGLVTNVVLNYIFISKWNACGAALASVVSEMIVLIIQTICIRSIIDWPVQMKNLIKTLLGGIIMFLVVSILEKEVLKGTSIVSTFILVMCGGIIYILIQLLVKNETVIEMLWAVKQRVSKKRLDSEE